MEKDDSTIKVIADRINTMQNDMGDLRDTMRISMDRMSNAVQKLVQMEERQFHMNQAYDRLTILFDKWMDKFEKLETRVDTLEKEQPMTQQVVKWVMRGVWAVVAAAAMFVAKTMGFV